MSGMETQVAVFFLLMAMRYFLKVSEGEKPEKRTQIWLGIALGFCMLSRPDFIIPCGIIGLWLLFTRPKCLPRIILFALIIYLPWIIFTTIYYGSPIPNTIFAKSASGLVSGIGDFVFSSVQTMRKYTPIYEWWWVDTKNIFILIICRLCFCIEFFLIILGAIYTAIKNKKSILFAIIFGVFVLYDVIFIHDTYYMWYLPPFTALAAILLATGLNWVFSRFRTLAISLSILLITVYILPLPSLFYLEKQVQEVIENGVRKKTGEKLAVLMGDSDSVILEPLGYIGYYARNKTIYDYPGLGSKIAVQSLKKVEKVNRASGFEQLCNDLKPTFVCFRPYEYDEICQRITDFDATYHLIETIESPVTEFHSGFLKTDRQMDACFMIFKRELKK
jgi:hypothetical protein